MSRKAPPSREAAVTLKKNAPPKPKVRAAKPTEKTAAEGIEPATKRDLSSRRHQMDMSAMNQPMEHMEKTAQKIMQACEEAGSLTREHMDATIRSANVAWEGCTEINRNMSSLLQESMARAMNAGKTIMGAKSVREVMDMQTEFMKEFMDCWVSGTGKISEISARVTQNAMSPLADHANNAMGKMAERVKSVA